MADMKSEKEQLKALGNLFQQKRFSDALELAKKASSDYPNSYHIKFLYARTLKELNKLAEAEEVLKELMLLYPNNINLLLESGHLAVIRNKFAEGNEFYNKILFLDPFNTEAKNSKEKINMIKKGRLPGKAIGDSLYHQNKKLQPVDVDTPGTLPEFDSRKLRHIINEEPPPPPPPPALGMEEIDSPPGMEATILVPPPIPDDMNAANIPDIPDIPDILETPIEMEQVMAAESQEPKEMIQKAEAPWQEEPGIEETGFVTESAAQLYVKQGLLDDAVVIYKKLWDSRKEERFLAKIKELKRVLVSQKKIRVLNELLEHIKLRGEKIV